MTSKIGLPVKIIGQTGKSHTGTVIFLHGSGDTGPGVYDWIIHLFDEFKFPHLKILLPSAPARPYTALQGQISNVWFDRKEISKFVQEDRESIDLMSNRIVELIKKEVDNGIPYNRIIVGGFSMGGALSLHVGYRFLPQLAGVFALSAFLNDGSVVYEELSQKERVPILFQWHGARDTLVPKSWGEETFKSLITHGVKGEFHDGRSALHELKRECLIKLHSWIYQRVPE